MLYERFFFNADSLPPPTPTFRKAIYAPGLDTEKCLPSPFPAHHSSNRTRKRESLEKHCPLSSFGGGGGRCFVCMSICNSLSKASLAIFFFKVLLKMHLSVRPLFHGDRVIDSPNMFISGMNKHFNLICEEQICPDSK